jgi:hypothetical protein
MPRWLTYPLPLGNRFQLKNTITPFAILSYLAVIPVVAAITIWWRSFSVLEAIIAGILSALIMFVSECVHQYGHAWAARSVGYPMIGLYHFSWFSASIYPKDEPPLPPATHIRRALGGFWINVLIGLVLGVFILWLWPHGWLGWVLNFAAVYNFFVLGLGALLPIDIPGVFTIDGGTLLHYWREIQNEKRQTSNKPNK